MLIFQEIFRAIAEFFDMVVKFSPYFLKGAFNTLILSILATVLGSALGLLLALARINESKSILWKIPKKLAGIYIEIIRGTPLMVQMLIVFSSFEGMERYTAGVIALSLNSAAYVAEIIRAGIQSIDKGQMEAARSLGMGVVLTYKEIILPQAIKNVLPALGNEFIVLIKETAIVSVVAISDLMYSVGIVQSIIFKPMPPLIMAMLIYLVMTMTLSKGMKGLERRFGRENER